MDKMYEQADKQKWDVEQVKEESWRFPMDERKRKASLQKIREGAENQDIRISHYPGFLACAASQLRFQSRGYWGLQAVLAAGGICLIQYLSDAGVDGSGMCAALSSFLVLAGNLALGGLGRIFGFHMEELEQTLYLDMKQMIAIQMALAGVMDLVFISILFMGAGTQVKIPAGNFLLYILVPFLWSDAAYLHLLMIKRGRMQGYRQAAFSMTAALASLFPAFVGQAYESVFLPVWAGMLFLGILLLVWEIRRLFGKRKGEELVCLN